MDNTDNLSPSVLCFVGDAVYGLLVRAHLAEINRPSGELHKESVKWVSAPAQTKIFAIIEPFLTEKEISVFKRGRNFHTNSSPKNATKQEYHTATGLEALFGYLYLSQENERIKELFDIVKKNYKPID
ncbi:MAG: ribonuclease III [Clostridia bacterium]|nr:ribonuclease III [Clostridia bacterium]